MDVDLYEPHPAPGAGPVYDPGQPAYLLMNFAADRLDMWWPQSRVAPRCRRLPFVAWSQAAGDDAATYPPRADAGRYLCEGLELLLRSTPPNIAVRLHQAAVRTVRPSQGGWEVVTDESAATYDEVLVAVGHQASSRTALANDWSLAAPLVPAVFPVERTLARDVVAPGAAVAIRGFALTFIDAALALTEGRGGSFEPLDHPYRLRYVPGPDDVGAILPFTRSGRPMLAKPGRAIAERTPALQDIAAEGRARIAALATPLRLHEDFVPILARSAHESLIAVAGDAAHESLDPATAIDRSLAVAAGLAPPGPSSALGHAWRVLYPAIVEHLGGDGLGSDDWPGFRRLAAEMERLAFGPPPLNAAKLLALIDAGRVDLTHLRGGRLAEANGHTLLRSAAGEHRIDCVVDAVLPPPGAADHGGLLADLVASGHARRAPGRRGLEITADASCRALDGSVSLGLAAIGRATEDWVIGNDTLNRSLHPHSDRWARRVVDRCRDAAKSRSRERAPA
jgi:diaminopimelate decarboxylase